MEVVEESKVDNVIGRVVADAVERGVVIFGAPIDGELTAGGSGARRKSSGGRGQKTGKKSVANKHCDKVRVYTACMYVQKGDKYIYRRARLSR